MKIIIVGAAYPYRGGLAAFSDRLAAEYMREGNEVEVVTFTMQYPGFLFPGKSQFSNEEKPKDLQVIRLINSVNPLSWIKTGKYIASRKPDKVIFCYWMAFMAPAFGTIARMVHAKGIKTLALIHNMIPHEPTILDKLFPRYFVNSMDGFVAMAESVVADIEQFDKNQRKKVVSPHPIYDHYGKKMEKDVAAMRLALHGDFHYVLFFGFIRQYKGLDLLLEAFADERLKNLPVKLVVAGEFYESPEPYLKMIHKYNLENAVELRTTFIPDKDVRNYFGVADLVAQPYRSATQSGVSQIAYHFEKPMLVTNVGGLAEIVPDGKVGYVVEVDPLKIADAIYDFFSNDRGKEFTSHIKNEKKKYAWSAMAEAINSL